MSRLHHFSWGAAAPASLKWAQYTPSVWYLKVQLTLVHHPTHKDPTNDRPKSSPKILHPDFIEVKRKCFPHKANMSLSVLGVAGTWMRRYRDDGCIGWRMWSMPSQLTVCQGKGLVNSNLTRNIRVCTQNRRQGRVSLGGQATFPRCRRLLKGSLVEKLGLRFQTLPFCPHSLCFG